MAALRGVNFECLLLLLKVSSKDQVVQLCQDAFNYHGLRQFPEHIVQKAAKLMSSEITEAQLVLQTLSRIITAVLYEGDSQPKQLAALFPDNFHTNLRDLLCRIFSQFFPQWHSRAVEDQVSLPKLVDFNIRVDVRTAADNVARMNAPTCLLQLQIQENSKSQEDRQAEVSDTTVELSKETLNTMVDGLGRIRDQMAAVARK